MLFIFTFYIFTVLLQFSHRFQRLCLFAYLIPMLLPYCPCLVCQFVSRLIPLYMSVLFSCYFFCLIFQTMSSYISFFMLTVPVSGLSYQFMFTMPFDVLTTPNTIVVWVHQTYLYSGGFFQGVLLDLHINYMLF